MSVEVSRRISMKSYVDRGCCKLSLIRMERKRNHEEATKQISFETDGKCCGLYELQAVG